MKKRRKPSVQKRIFAARRAGWSEAFRQVMQAHWNHSRIALESSGSDDIRHRSLVHLDAVTELRETLREHRCAQWEWFGDDPPTNDKP